MGAEDVAKAVTASIWQCPPEEVFPDDFTDEYSWIKNHEVYWIVNEDRKGLLVVVDHREQVMVFPDKKTVGNMNRLFASEGVEPAKLDAEELAKTIRHFLKGVGGFVGTPSFWERQKEDLEDWGLGDTPEDRELFKHHCEPPRLTRAENRWSVEFSYFNNQGGIETWKTDGEGPNLREIHVESAVPDGTLQFPYE